MFMNIFTPSPIATPAPRPIVRADIDPEAGATTAEYGMLAGGVVVGGGILYQLLTSPFFNELIKKIFEFLATLIIDTIQDAIAFAGPLTGVM